MARPPIATAASGSAVLVHDQLRIRVLSWMLVIGMAACLPFGAIDILHQLWDEALLNTFSFVFMGAMLVLARSTGRFLLTSWLVLAFAAGAMFYLSRSADIGVMGAFWSLVFPLVAMILVGPTGGTIACIVHGGATAIAMAVDGGSQGSTHPVADAIRFLFVYASVAAITGFYESVRWHTLTRSENTLRTVEQSGDRYRRLFQASNDGVVIHDNRGTILDVNPAACRLFDSVQAALLGKDIRTFVSDPRALPGTAQWQAADGIPRFETELISNKSIRVPVEVSCSYIDDERGAIQCIIRDISSRRENELRQRDYAHQLATLSDSSMQFLSLPSQGDELDKFIGRGLCGLLPGAVVLLSEVSPDGTQLILRGVWGVEDHLLLKALSAMGFNPVGRAFAIDDNLIPFFLEDRPVEIAGGLAQLSRSALPEPVCHAISALLNLGSIYTMGLVRKGQLVGCVHAFLRRGAQLTNAGLLEAFVRQASIALHRRALERELVSAWEIAERANSAKTQFLANTSHEIRTPITTIVGMAELALLKSPEPELREYVEAIKSSGFGLLDIIDNILDLSKIETGKMSLEAIPFDVREIASKACSLVALQAREKGLEITCAVHHSVPQAAIGDPTRLRQVLLNLLTNAVKFTDRGSITLSVTHPRDASDSRMLSFSVKDTGCGIPVNKLSAVFESFVQADGSIARTHGGSGLGLSISRQLARLMKGDITVESEVGRGTTFIFNVPFDTTHEQPQAPAKAPAPSQEPLPSATVLVVEDNDLNRRILVTLLRNWGLSVLEASGGAEAVERFKSAAVDLVLMDVQMPEVDGLEATRRIRALDNGRTPIVALTAHALTEDRNACFTAGMNEYLSKPFRVEQVRELLQRYHGSSAPVALAVCSLPAEALVQPESARSHAPAATAEAPKAELADFQPAEMLRRLGGDKEIIDEALKMFLEGPTRVEDMRSALAKGDFTALTKLAHTVRGVALTVSATRLASAATSLEVSARNSAPRECAAGIDTLAQAQSTARVAVAQYLRGASNST